MQFDYVNITKFNRTKQELEELALFSILAYNNSSKAAAITLDKLGWSSFASTRGVARDVLADMLRNAGSRFFNQKAAAIHEVSNSDIDLANVSLPDLMKVRGFGPKTARLFILHSRPQAVCVPLDRHILSFLRDNGVDAPFSTPGDGRRYRELEKAFIGFAQQSELSLAEFDLKVWRQYSRN
jgi:thermostable 8-oxoguanine DNA glycosylase